MSTLLLSVRAPVGRVVELINIWNYKKIVQGINELAKKDSSVIYPSKV